jgi:uroporphyrin-III C-methyltransferase
MSNTKSQGNVVLAGAGPGDPELVTLKLLRSIQQAEVLIVDRLVNPGIWQQYAKPDAEIIIAGKQGYNYASYTQQEVNQLLVEKAVSGKRVLRLKGGDVAFFSNVLDELQVLTELGIPFSIIPGITAASGVSAYAGIPLTARGYANAVQFVAYNPGSVYDDLFWLGITSPTATVVLYMASKNLRLFVEKMLEHQANPDTPIAVIEQATTSHQQVHVSTLKKAVRELCPIEFSSPSLVIVGQVVSLHKQFNWFEGQKEGSVFPSLNLQLQALIP